MNLNRLSNIYFSLNYHGVIIRFVIISFVIIQIYYHTIHCWFHSIFILILTSKREIII